MHESKMYSCIFRISQYWRRSSNSTFENLWIHKSRQKYRNEIWNNVPIKFLLQSIFEEFSVLDQIEVGCSIHLLVWQQTFNSINNKSMFVHKMFSNKFSWNKSIHLFLHSNSTLKNVFEFVWYLYLWEEKDFSYSV